MAVKTPSIGDTVQFRNAAGETRAVVVLALQAQAGAAPSAPAVANSGAGGVLTAATYSYRISRVRLGAESLASAAGTTVVGGGTTNKCSITLPGEAGFSYRIYGRVGGSELFIGESAVGAVNFDDTGAVTPAGALPATDGRIGVYDPHVPASAHGGGTAPIIKQTAKHGAGSTNVYFKH